jgi:hypothetical protein
MGFGAMGLGDLLAETSSISLNPLVARQPPLPARAKRVVHLFMNGGPSHLDTFDPKPSLDQYDGKAIPSPLKTERPTGAGLKSPYAFQKYGKSGIEVSELFAKTAQHADDLCIIRSMHTVLPNHEPSLGLLNCGEARLNRPSLGSWITYGLGSMNQNLPGYIAMCPGGMPIRRTKNWQAGFLPSAFQGAYVNTDHESVDKLVEFIRNGSLDSKRQREQLDLLLAFNQRHLAERQKDTQLEARIQSFELAYRMQMEADDAFDLSKEPAHIHQLYGEGLQARQMMIARRLLERGVRFVQVWHGAGQPWDSHDDIKTNHGRLARECDQPIAALLKDLKQRGLLDDTLVLWGGEFGRTPTVELPDLGANSGMVNGRDHNPYGFSMWLAGGGVKKGLAYGATDEFGFAAAHNKVHVHDLHATMLHLLGFDHEKFTYRYAGRDFRLTDVHGRVVHDLLA